MQKYKAFFKIAFEDKQLHSITSYIQDVHSRISIIRQTNTNI